MTNFLFPKPVTSKGYSLLLLALRILFGILFMTHGISKILNYTELCFTFPDPIGIGKEVSLVLAIFGELFCSIAFLFGALYRLFTIPMIIVMVVAFFHIHQGDMAQCELAFLYLIIMYISGHGKYSIDKLVYNYLHKYEYN